MLSLPDPASMQAALQLDLDPVLRRLLANRIADAAASDLLNLTHILVVQPGDCEHTITDEIAMSPLVNPADGARFGSPGFQPWWDWLLDHSSYYEMLVCVGDAGFAYILLIADAEGVQPELLALCRAYTEQGGGETR